MGPLSAGGREEKEEWNDVDGGGERAKASHPRSEEEEEELPLPLLLLELRRFRSERNSATRSRDEDITRLSVPLLFAVGPRRKTRERE